MSSMNRRRLGRMLAGVAAAAPGAALAHLVPPAVDIDPARLGGVDALLDRLVARGLLAGASVQVAQHGRVLRERFVGQADIAAARRFGPDAILRLYSMTKPVTAAAIMMLYEDGALLLTDPVSKYVPEFAALRVHVAGEGEAMRTEPARPMRIVDLLVHTSGISNSWNPGPIAPLYVKAGLTAGTYIHDARIKGLPDVATRMATVPLTFQPGTRWLYSFATDIAGLVVERASGMGFGAFLETRLFRPLGMTDTGFFVPPDKAGRLASNYGLKAGALQLVEAGAGSPFLNPPSAQSGAAGLLSTLGDYGRFAAMLAQGGTYRGTTILSRAGAALMMSNHVPPAILADTLERFMAVGTGGSGGGAGYALGGAVLQDVGLSHNEGVQGEYTWGGAASTTFWAAPSIGLSVVMMTQLMPSGTLPLRDWLKAAVYRALV